MSVPVGDGGCILRVSDGQAPASLLLIDGVRLTGWKIAHELVDVTTQGDGGWQRLLSGAGLRSLEVKLAGLYLGSAGELRLRAAAFAGTAFDGELTLDRGEIVRGQFIVAELTLESAISEEPTFAVLLRTAGPITIL